MIGGENGIEVEMAERVLLERVTIRGATLDGINVRRGQVTIRDCSISMLGNEYGQGIDISFTADLAPSVVENCLLTGGQEGIFVDSVHAMARENRVRQTTLRGITVTEMSMADVEENDGRGCSRDRHLLQRLLDVRYPREFDYGVRPDHESSDSMREGYAIVSHYWAHVEVEDNDDLAQPPRRWASSAERVHYLRVARTISVIFSLSNIVSREE